MAALAHCKREPAKSADSYGVPQNDDGTVAMAAADTMIGDGGYDGNGVWYHITDDVKE